MGNKQNMTTREVEQIQDIIDEKQDHRASEDSFVLFCSRLFGVSPQPREGFRSTLKRDLLKKHPSFAENSVESRSANNSFFTQLHTMLMKKQAMVGALVVAALIVGGGLLVLNSNKASTYEDHVAAAYENVEALSEALRGERLTSVSVPFFVDVAHAEGETSKGDITVSGEYYSKGGGYIISEETVDDFTVAVVAETEAAIEIVENLDGNLEAQIALADINDLQAISLAVFTDAAALVESDEAQEAVAEAIDLTAEQAEAVAEVLLAIESGDEDVAVDIETSEDKTAEELEAEKAAREAERQALVDDRLAELTTYLETLDPESAEYAHLKKQLDRAEEGLADGKLGRAYGLTTSLAAKMRNAEKRAEIREKKVERLGEERVAELEAKRGGEFSKFKKNADERKQALEDRKATVEERKANVEDKKANAAERKTNVQERKADVPDKEVEVRKKKEPKKPQASTDRRIKKNPN